MGNAGYDWVVVDQGMVQSAMINYQIFFGLRIRNTLPRARLVEGPPEEVKDVGSGGVIVPMIETAEQLEKA